MTLTSTADMAFGISPDSRQTFQKSIELSHYSFAALPIFSIHGVQINVEPEFHLSMEADVDASGSVYIDCAYEMHAEQHTVTTLDARGGKAVITQTSDQPQFTFKSRYCRFGLDGFSESTLQVIPELRLNIDYIGWVNIKQHQSLYLPQLGVRNPFSPSPNQDRNTCPQTDQTQVWSDISVYSSQEAKLKLGFAFASQESKVVSDTSPVQGPFTILKKECHGYDRRRRAEDSHSSNNNTTTSTTTSTSTTASSTSSTSTTNSQPSTTMDAALECPECMAARPLPLGEATTIDTCSDDASVWPDSLSSQCGAATFAAAGGKSGESPTPPAAHLVLQPGVGHFRITTAPASNADSAAVVQVRRSFCCDLYGLPASCATSPSTQSPQEVTTLRANETLYLVVTRLDGSCGPVTVTIVRDTTPRFFVDCNATAAGATGDYGAPLPSLAHALETVAARHAADQGANVDYPAVVTLMPNQRSGCVHALPAGYRLPSALKGVHLTLTSLHGEEVTAMSLYDAHLKQCDATATADGTADTCFSQTRFAAMSGGSAYDTRLGPAAAAAGDEDVGFAVDAGESITFRGLGFEGFATSGNGASIRSDGAEIMVENCLFVSSAAEGRGGAIFARGGNVTVSGTVALNGRAAEGGFLAAEDAARVAVYHSLVAHSDASTGGGGAIYTEDSRLALAGAEFVGNSAETRGGAVCVEGASAAVALDGQVSFTSNDAGRYGGAMSIAQGARAASEGGMRMERNIAGLAGGAVAVMGADSQWADSSSVLDGNAAPAIYTLGGAHAALAGTKVRHSSPVGTSNAFTTTRPGALLCAHGSVELDADALLLNSFDMYANTMNNIACVDCAGCNACGSCSLCGRCTAQGCDAGHGTRECVALFGAGAVCSETSGFCVPPKSDQGSTQGMSTPDVTPAPETTASGGSGGAVTTTTSTGSTSTSAPCTDATLAGSQGAQGVHAGFRSATYALSVLLAITLVVLAAVVVRSPSFARRRTGGDKELEYAMYDEDEDADRQGKLPPVAEAQA